MVEFFAGAIVAIIGFLASIFKDYIQDYRRNEKERKKEKLEMLNEIFITLSEVTKTYRELLINIKSNTSEQINISEKSTRISFLIRVYFPHLLPDYQEYLQIGARFSTVQMKLAGLDLKLHDEKDNYEDLFVRLNEVSGDLFTKIVNESNNYIE